MLCKYCGVALHVPAANPESFLDHNLNATCPGNKDGHNRELPHVIDVLVRVSSEFESSGPNDAVRQMIDWFYGSAYSTGYRVEALGTAGDWFLEADDVYTPPLPLTDEEIERLEALDR